MSEYIIGRAGQASSAIGSSDDLTRRSKVSGFWSSGAWFGMIASFLIVSFYCVVAAWVLSYIPKFLFGSFNGSIVSGLASGGTSEAVGFMFTPDFSKITPQVATSALGQACFSIGIGNAIMITYGSYLPRNVSIPKAAVTVATIDTCVAIIAGLAIFPIVFSNNLDFSAGAGIFFQTLPTALGGSLVGNIIGAGFFFLAFFAAITSSVSLLEPSVAYVAERFKMTKRKAAFVTGAGIVTLGLGSLYSPKFFEFIDTGLAGPILAPLSALKLGVSWLY